LVAEESGEAVFPSIGKRLGGEEVSGEGPGAVVLPEVVEGVGEAGR
jgi:hypothetical protein